MNNYSYSRNVNPKKIKLRLVINLKELFYAVLIGCFFEPPIISYMQRDGVHAGLSRWISYIYAAMKIVVSFFAILNISVKKDKPTQTTSISIWLIVYSLSILIACVINGSIGISQTALVIQQIGLISFLYYNSKHYSKTLHAAGTSFFGFMSVLCVLNVLLFPKGLYTSTAYYSSGSIYSSIFIFGGKNAAFPYLFCFLFSWISYQMKWNRKTVNAVPVIIVFMLAAYRCQSINTIICLGLILIFYILMVMFPRVFRWFNPVNVFVAILAVIVLIYLDASINLFNNILQYFGRDTTYSGRSMIWKQAIQYVRQHPLFGAGSGITFSTIYASVSHAHSQYLDRLAKYGIVSFAFLFFSIVVYIKSLGSEKDWKLRNILLVMSAVYMLHMTFDTYHINYLLYIAVLGASVVSSESSIEEPQLQ